MQTPVRTRIKVCGMTDPDQVRAAVDMGVDAIGMILHADSPRRVDSMQARRIRAEVPAFVSLVGVFVNCEASRVNQLIAEIGLDLVQLHGDESNQFGAALARPFIKAVRAKSKSQVTQALQQYPDARAILLDAYVEGQYGGTGHRVDPELWPRQAAQKLILAGGLDHDNVGALVAELMPYAVDLNSGVESAPGHKDMRLMAEAIRSLRV